MKEKVKERCLGLLLNEHTKNYLQLLQISEKPTLRVKRLRILKIEIFKTLNGLNPDFMTELMTVFFVILAIQLIRNITFKCTSTIHQVMAIKTFTFLGHICEILSRKTLNQQLQSINLKNS